MFLACFQVEADEASGRSSHSPPPPCFCHEVLNSAVRHIPTQGVRGVLKSLKFSCIKFKALKSLKLYKKVLIMISRGLKFGDGKTRIAIWLNVTIKLQKAMISLNKHERCTFKVRCCAALCSVFTRKTVIFQPKATPAGRE